MKRHLLAFFILTLLTVLGIGVFLTANGYLFSGVNADEFNVTKISSQNIINSPINQYYAESQVTSSTRGSVVKSDARPVIVDNFLAANGSPMAGLGTMFVTIADKYSLDWRLLPAIAFQESILGKKMPKGSHNAFGWAIYTGQQSGASFRNWEQALEIVAAGLKENYIDQGLKTPEAIMTRYSPDSDGAWAFGVQFAMNEMSSQ